MAVLLNKKKLPPKPQPKIGSAGYYQSRATPIKPVVPKAAPKLPGSPGWGQAAEYGWTGSPDPGVVTRATIDRYLSPFPGGTGNPKADQPSYEGLIGGDWEVQDAEAAMGARLASLRGDFATNLKQALIDLGVTDAGKLGSFGQYLDADTIAKAAANKYSTSAQVATAERKASRQNRAALAGRGILSSGALTKSEADIAAQAESKRYDALRTFLTTGSEGLRNIADEEYGLARGVAQARAAAAARAASIYQLPDYSNTTSGDQPFYGYEGDYGEAPAVTAPRVAARPALRPGMARGTQGQYLTKAGFSQQRPGGNYQSYLSYLRKARGGRL